MSALWAAMPKATVNENSQARVVKIEIWFAWQFVSVDSPSANTCPNESKTEDLFGALVAFAPDGSHNVGTRRGHGCKAAGLEFGS
jgi:hypothetical protein